MDKEYFGRNQNGQFFQEFGRDIFSELKNSIYWSKDTKNIKMIHKEALDKYDLNYSGYSILYEYIVISWANYVDDIDILEYGGYELLPTYLSSWKREVKIAELLKEN